MSRRYRSSGAATRAQSRAYRERAHELAAQLRGELAVAPSLRARSLRSSLRSQGPLPLGPLPPGLVMLMGFPGAGKSHCARLLAQRLGAAHVASDQLRSRLFIAASYTAAENAAVFAALDALVDGLLAEGHLVIVDATNLRRRNRAAATALARRRRVPLVHVLVSSEETSIRSRLAERAVARAPGDHSDADERVLDLMHERGFEPPRDGYLELRNGPDLPAEIERIALAVEACLRGETA